MIASLISGAGVGIRCQPIATKTQKETRSVPFFVPFRNFLWPSPSCRLTAAVALVLGVIGAGNSAWGKLTPEQIGLLPPPASRQVSFGKDIRPILEASCTKCHGRGRSKGDFRLDTRETLLKGGESGAAVVSGKSEQSYLVELVSGLDPDNVMPRKGKKLTAEEIGDDQPLFGAGSLGLDSVDALQLVVALDKTFGLKIADPAAAKQILQSVNTIAEAVRQNTPTP